jgi:SAM-dependent methyltransferase
MSAVPTGAAGREGQVMAIDQERLEAFIHQFAGDFGAALHASTVVVGDKLGLYRTLAERGPVAAAELAAATGCDPRLVEEWLAAQYVSGYCHHSDQTGTYWLSPEQAAVLADPSSPTFMAGAMAIAVSTAKDEGKVRGAFLSGEGLGWHEHHHDLFHGTERLFKPGYLANLVSTWIPSLDGVEATLQAGGRIADLGCGHGASTILLAQAYPAASVVGFDYHPASIDVARKRAAEAGVADRVCFEVASAQDFPGEGYDLVCIFDALHDMGDPAGAAGHIREALDEGGTWLLVEPMAGERLEDNVNPVGRIFYAASTSICTPSAQAQPGGQALGAQVPEARLAELVAGAGFGRFRRATETPFNRVYEARP